MGRPTHDAVGALLGRLRDWWRRQEELRALDDKEIGRVAADLRMSTNALRDLVARGPDAAHLLYERMRALGISEADVRQAADGVMRDLQRTCAVCSEKGVCEWDLGNARMILCGRAIVTMRSRSSPSRS